MLTANFLSTTAPAKQVGESSLERGDFLFQTLPPLPKLEAERERETHSIMIMLKKSEKCPHLIQNTLGHSLYLMKV